MWICKNSTIKKMTRGRCYDLVTTLFTCIVAEVDLRLVRCVEGTRMIDLVY